MLPLPSLTCLVLFHLGLGLCNYSLSILGVSRTMNLSEYGLYTTLESFGLDYLSLSFYFDQFLTFFYWTITYCPIGYVLRVFRTVRDSTSSFSVMVSEVSTTCTRSRIDGVIGVMDRVTDLITRRMYTPYLFTSSPLTIVQTKSDS